MVSEYDLLLSRLSDIIQECLCTLDGLWIPHFLACVQLEKLNQKFTLFLSLALLGNMGTLKNGETGENNNKQECIFF